MPWVGGHFRENEDGANNGNGHNQQGDQKDQDPGMPFPLYNGIMR